MFFRFETPFSHALFFYHRQDALQRHWDKYCRKKSKRHLDKQASETPDRASSSVPIPLYALGTLAQTTSTTAATNTTIGTGLDQVINALKIFKKKKLISSLFLLKDANELSVSQYIWVKN